MCKRMKHLGCGPGLVGLIKVRPNSMRHAVSKFTQESSYTKSLGSRGAIRKQSLESTRSQPLAGSTPGTEIFDGIHEEMSTVSPIYGGLFIVL